MAPIGHRGQQAIVTSGIFTGLAVITVLLRLFTRFFIVRCPGIEDYFISLSMLCSIGLTICIAIQAEYGMGQHIATLSASDMRRSLKAFWASLIVYYLSLGLTKSSILLQYRRVFPTKGFRIASWSIMAVVVVYTVWTVLGSIFACVPIQAFWTKEPAKCINQFAMWFANAGINILTDFAIIILPMPVIRNLNLARRQKQALTVIFAIGGLVCIISVLRLQSLVAISNSTDPTYDNPPAATWSSVETNIGIICSCLPCLRPLMGRIIPGRFASYHKSTTNTPYTTRNMYGRQSSGPAIRLDSRDRTHTRGTCDSESTVNDKIQVTTVIDMRVEKSKECSSRSGQRKKMDVSQTSQSSSETFVNDLDRIV